MADAMLLQFAFQAYCPGALCSLRHGSTTAASKSADMIIAMTMSSLKLHDVSARRAGKAE